MKYSYGFLEIGKYKKFVLSKFNEKNVFMRSATDNYFSLVTASLV